MRFSLFFPSLLPIACVFITSSAAADESTATAGSTAVVESTAEETVPSDARPTKLHNVSLTLNPVQPLFGVALLNGEVRLSRLTVFPKQTPKDVSFGGWVGLGRIRIADGGMLADGQPVWANCNDIAYCDRLTVVWVGAQALVYPVGTFDHGLQLGVEASVMTAWGYRRYGKLYDEIGASFAKAAGKQWAGLPDEKLSDTSFFPGIVIGYKLATKSGFTVNPQLAGDLLVSTTERTTILPRLAVNAGWSF
jgi:hypothetical protein